MRTKDDVNVQHVATITYESVRGCMLLTTVGLNTALVVLWNSDRMEIRRSLRSNDNTTRVLIEVWWQATKWQQACQLCTHLCGHSGQEPAPAASRHRRHTDEGKHLTPAIFLINLN